MFTNENASDQIGILIRRIEYFWSETLRFILAGLTYLLILSGGNVVKI